MFQYEAVIAIEYSQQLGIELAKYMKINFDNELFQKAMQEKNSDSINNIFIMANSHTVVIIDCNNRDIMYGVIVIGECGSDTEIVKILLKWHKITAYEYHQKINEDIENVFNKDCTLLKHCRNYYDHDILSLCTEWTKWSNSIQIKNGIEDEVQLRKQLYWGIKRAVLKLMKTCNDKNEDIYIISFVISSEIRDGRSFYPCGICADVKRKKLFQGFGEICNMENEKQWSYYFVTDGLETVAHYLKLNLGNSGLDQNNFCQIINAVVDVYVKLREEGIFDRHKEILLTYNDDFKLLDREQNIYLIKKTNENIDTVEEYIR